jgi:hypothetical protein
MFITAIGLAVSLAAAPADARLRVAVTFDSGASPSLRAAVLKEAARIWAPYHVAIGLDPAAITLHVSFVEHPTARLNDHSLGSIDFCGGLPEPAISLYAGTAADLVWGASQMTGTHWPEGYKHVLVERVLGRALAHEIGHFLLRSTTHSPEGLMSANQAVVDLMAVDDPKLVLTAHDQDVLEQTVSTLTSDTAHRR